MYRFINLFSCLYIHIDIYIYKYIHNAHTHTHTLCNQSWHVCRAVLPQSRLDLFTGWPFEGGYRYGSFKGDIDIDIDVDGHFACFKGASKSA